MHPYHFAGYNGRALGAAVVQVGDVDVIQSEHVQDGGVDVVDVERPLDGAQADLVGRADDWPPLTPPPAIHIVKPHGCGRGRCPSR